jgi:DNA anti-recombination protein RmuC
MEVITNYITDSQPENIYKSYKVILYEDITKINSGYSSTKKVMNTREYREYKDSKTDELEKQSKQLTENFNSSDEKIQALQAGHDELKADAEMYANTMDSLIIDIIPSLSATTTP